MSRSSYFKFTTWVNKAETYSVLRQTLLELRGVPLFSFNVSFIKCRWLVTVTKLC